MKGINIGKLVNLGKAGLRSVNGNLPAILGGAAIAGVIATAWTTYKAAPKIRQALDDAESDKAEKLGDTADEEAAAADEKLTVWETFTAVAPHVWKPAACGVFTVGCIVGAQVLNMQRLTMLAGAYKLSEKKLKEYEEKAKELLGAEKAVELHDETMKAIAPTETVSESEVIRTGKGGRLCYDKFSGRYFYSSMEAIREAESTLNKAILNGEYMSLNDLYYELGLDNIKMGSSFGWDCQTGPVDIKVTIADGFVNDSTDRQMMYILDYEPKYNHGF